MRHWIALAAVLSLAGCKTIAEAQSERDDAKCVSYGAPKGSPAYTQCRLQLEQNRSNERAAFLGSPSPASMIAPQAAAPRHCMWVGQVWTCH